MSAKTAKTITITLKRSVSRRPQNQVATVRALGLRRIGQSLEVNDNPTMRGMINTVKHLIEVHEVQE